MVTGEGSLPLLSWTRILLLYFLSSVQLRRVVKWFGGHLVSRQGQPTTCFQQTVTKSSRKDWYLGSLNFFKHSLGQLRWPSFLKQEILCFGSPTFENVKKPSAIPESEAWKNQYYFCHKILQMSRFQFLMYIKDDTFSSTLPSSTVLYIDLDILRGLDIPRRCLLQVLVNLDLT